MAHDGCDEKEDEGEKELPDLGIGAVVVHDSDDEDNAVSTMVAELPRPPRDPFWSPEEYSCAKHDNRRKRQRDNVDLTLHGGAAQLGPKAPMMCCQCGEPVSEAAPASLGCCEHCHRPVCSYDCRVAHEQRCPAGPTRWHPWPVGFNAPSAQRPAPRCWERCHWGYISDRCPNRCIHARGHRLSHDCSQHCRRPKQPPPPRPP